MLLNAPDGHHLAFEQIPSHAKSLLEKFPSVEIFNMALGDKTGNTPFYINPTALALSGLDKREHRVKGEQSEKIIVQIERLDNVVSLDSDVNLIKIDVEGAQGLVFLGAVDTIKKDQPFIIFEHSGESSNLFGISSAQIYDLIVNECGLNISLLSNWLNNKSPLTKAQFIDQKEWYFIAHPPLYNFKKDNAPI